MCMSYLVGCVGRNIFVSQNSSSPIRLQDFQSYRTCVSSSSWGVRAAIPLRLRVIALTLPLHAPSGSGKECVFRLPYNFFDYL